jgi:hypothetical protein
MPPISLLEPQQAGKVSADTRFSPSAVGRNLCRAPDYESLRPLWVYPNPSCNVGWFVWTRNNEACGRCCAASWTRKSLKRLSAGRAMSARSVRDWLRACDLLRMPQNHPNTVNLEARFRAAAGVPAGDGRFSNAPPRGADVP